MLDKAFAMGRYVSECLCPDDGVDTAFGWLASKVSLLVSTALMFLYFV
jgi:hypothetical protein